MLSMIMKMLTPPTSASRKKQIPQEHPVSTFPDDALVDNCVWDSLLKELNVQFFFGTLKDVVPIIDKYQKRSGNHVAVCRSQRARFRLYKCVEHKNCTFRVHIVGRRRLDGRFVIKKQSVMKHTTLCRPSKDKNGRIWKERRAGRLDEFVSEASKIKSGFPTTQDIITALMFIRRSILLTMSFYETFLVSYDAFWVRSHSYIVSCNCDIAFVYTHCVKRV